jgi:hypothetical protein
MEASHVQAEARSNAELGVRRSRRQSAERGKSYSTEQGAKHQRQMKNEGGKVTMEGFKKQQLHANMIM